MGALTPAKSCSEVIKTDDDLLQIVMFSLGSEEYAIHILKVHEVVRMKEITRVPNSPSYVEGVINLRGSVIPVVNLRRKFGLAGMENNEYTRIMIMDIQGIAMGLVVDSVSEVLRIPSSAFKPAPPMASGISAEFIKGIATLDKRLIILLDMDTLLGRAEGATVIEVTAKALKNR